MLNIANYYRNTNQNYIEVSTHTRVAIIKKFTNNKCWRGCGEKGTLLHRWWECKLVQSLWKTVWRVLRELKIELSYNQRSHSWPYIHTNLYIEKMHACLAALLTIAKTWKQPKCPPLDEWINKLWCIYTMEYYSAIKMNEMLPFAATWMQLEVIILSEVSQKEKDKYHMISLICGI